MLVRKQLKWKIEKQKGNIVKIHDFGHASYKIIE